MSVYWCTCLCDVHGCVGDGQCVGACVKVGGYVCLVYVCVCGGTKQTRLILLAVSKVKYSNYL